MQSLKNNYLGENEVVIDRFSPITVIDMKYDCALTNQRILLYKRNLAISTHINYDSFTKMSLEKDWYDDFFFGTFICSIFGICLFSAWLLSFFPASLGISPEIVNILRFFLYPSIILLIVACISVYFYWTRFKYFLLLSGANYEHRLYSKPALLSNLITILKDIQSEKITLTDIQRLPELPIEARLSGQTLNTFENIDVRITFKDESNQKRTIRTKTKIILGERSMHIIAMLRFELMKYNKFKGVIESNIVPLFTEENFHQIHDLAKEMNVNTILLLNVDFAYNRVSSKKFRLHLGLLPSKSLIFRIDTSLGPITLEIIKRNIIPWKPAKNLLEFENTINTHLM